MRKRFTPTPHDNAYADYQAIMITCCVRDARLKHRQAVLSNLLYSHLHLRDSSADEEHSSNTPATFTAACDVKRFHPSSAWKEMTPMHRHLRCTCARLLTTSSWTPSAVVPALVSGLVFLLTLLPELVVDLKKTCITRPACSQHGNAVIVDSVTFKIQLGK